MTTYVMAGVAEKNASLFRRIGVPLGDPAAWIETDGESMAMVRDLEMDRVREQAVVDVVTCPAEYSPASGLSPDRETATAEAVVEFLQQRQVVTVTTDRTLPYLFAWHLLEAGIRVEYDASRGVVDRRSKSDEEIESLRRAQAVTEEVMRVLCETVATATAATDGQLHHEGVPLTSDRLRTQAAIEFLHHGFSMSQGAIVATPPEVADCHHSGSGPVRTGIPVVIDLFPRDESSRFWGDCTRTVVHGEPSEAVKRMHAAVLEAKGACAELLTPGQTADAAHRAAEDTLLRHGYHRSRGTITDEPSIQHGTGHGIGLELHEPILLDAGGEEMLRGEVFTVEPGLYGRIDGGVRVEDMLVVAAGGPRNLNRLHEGLDWRP